MWAVTDSPNDKAKTEQKMGFNHFLHISSALQLLPFGQLATLHQHASFFFNVQAFKCPRMGFTEIKVEAEVW